MAKTRRRVINELLLKHPSRNNICDENSLSSEDKKFRNVCIPGEILLVQCLFISPCGRLLVDICWLLWCYGCLSLRVTFWVIWCEISSKCVRACVYLYTPPTHKVAFPWTTYGCRRSADSKSCPWTDIWPTRFPRIVQERHRRKEIKGKSVAFLSIEDFLPAGSRLPNDFHAKVAY